MIALVDAHAHIHGEEYDADRAAVLQRARAAGVQAIITAGTDLQTSALAAGLAERESAVWATAGIHPHDAAGCRPGDLDKLAALAESPRVVAIGEIGLDFYRNLSPPEIQARVLRDQLDLADRLGLPVVIHSRDADVETRAILAPWSERRRGRGLPEPFGVMHCYAYGPDRIAAYAALGLYISLPGTVTYPKAISMHLAAAAVPQEMLVLETDCPYLTPQSRRGRRNEPALVTETAARVAALRGVSLEALSATSTANACRLYRLPVDAIALQADAGAGSIPRVSLPLEEDQGEGNRLVGREDPP